MFSFFLKKTKQTIGRIETVDPPELGIMGIQAKIDTGAYRSTIHANAIHEEVASDGMPILSFRVLDEAHPKFDGRTVTAHEFVRVRVKSSNGEVSERYKIKTPVVIRGQEFITDFTLSDRASMRHPVLIGRKVLRHRFVVDVSLT